jgi:serine/threonine-protein kinase
VILRALEKDPAARFADMAAFASALREACAALPGYAASTGAPAAASPEPAASSGPAGVRRAGLEAEVRAGAGAPEQLAVRELTRSGAFLCASGALPPLLSRVRITLAHPSLRAPLALVAEVVRHVSAAEAASWRMAPGFAVQFVDLAPADRAALAAVADGQRRDTPAALAGEPLLLALEARARGSHYAFLGVGPDAEFTDVRRTVRALREALDAIRARPHAADHPARATGLLVRLEAAQSALATPAARLAHDAERGNALGVARCLAAGVPHALVDARRAELLRAAPARGAEADRQRARAEVARKLGNAPAALAAYEAALAADPLDVATLDAYLALRRQTSGAR